LKEIDCLKFEECSAPLCPLADNLKDLVSYPDEEICRARKFQSLPWIKKQKRIAKLGLTIDDGFFTVEMLNSIRAITKNLKGADPSDFDSGAKWLKQRAEKRAMVSQKRRNNKAKQYQKTHQVIAKKRGNLVPVANLSHQRKRQKCEG
jgi:hypothetical protein